MNLHTITTACLAGLLTLAACEDKGRETPASGTNQVNQWIERTMRDNYLWYDEMPAERTLNYKAEPEDFFAKLLSDNDGKDSEEGHHYFSTLEKAVSTKFIADANDTYGFDYAVSTVQGQFSSYKIALVLYVHKDSPAEEAGLRRGHWILGVNGEAGTIQDYDVLDHGSGDTFQLGEIRGQNTLVPTRTVAIGASRAVEDTPFLKDSVYTIGNRRIGYLMYNHFSPSPDEHDYEDTTYDRQLQQLFERFKGQGVNEFVLDLRYNGGGIVSSAILLASLLAPESALGKTMCYIEYNDKNSAKNEEVAFTRSTETVAGNLGLSRLFVLTGSTTASSSELLINSLRPYMEVRVIGLRTYGKTVGMSVYDESDRYGWILSPVTFRSYNRDHEADYEDGIVPDVEINEFQSDLVELGDLEDPLLGQAMREITGERVGLRAASEPVSIELRHRSRHPLRDNLLRIERD